MIRPASLIRDEDDRFPQFQANASHIREGKCYKWKYFARLMTKCPHSRFNRLWHQGLQLLQWARMSTARNDHIVLGDSVAVGICSGRGRSVFPDRCPPSCQWTWPGSVHRGLAAGDQRNSAGRVRTARGLLGQSIAPYLVARRHFHATICWTAAANHTNAESQVCWNRCVNVCFLIRTVRCVLWFLRIQFRFRELSIEKRWSLLSAAESKRCMLPHGIVLNR